MNTNLEHPHDSASIRDRVRKTGKHSYLRDFVYGAIDGTVTTFAVVSSIAGAGLNSEIVIVLGLANLLGDGFSMAASNYLGTRTEEQVREKAIAMERRHIRLVPNAEKEEVRQIFAAKGFAGDDLERAVAIITSDEQRWIETMLVDELGMSLESPNAFKAAATTFFAFFSGGAFAASRFPVRDIPTHRIRMVIRDQYCNDGRCFFPCRGDEVIFCRPEMVLVWSRNFSCRWDRCRVGLHRRGAT